MHSALLTKTRTRNARVVSGIYDFAVLVFRIYFVCRMQLGVTGVHLQPNGGSLFVTWLSVGLGRRKRERARKKNKRTTHPEKDNGKHGNCVLFENCGIVSVHLFYGEDIWACVCMGESVMCSW